MSKTLKEIRKGTLHKLIIHSSKSHMHRSVAMFNEIGLSKGQPKILDFLAYNDGCSQKELAIHCRIEPATVTSILTNMEKSDLIYRTQNTQDKRIWNVFLTEKGKKLQKEVENIFLRLDEECLKNFTEEEKNMLFILLNKLASNLEERKDVND